MTDLLELTAELVDIPSVSHHERVIADHIEAELRNAPWLDVHRIGDNVVARTSAGRDLRLVLAGHLDTVPPNGNERARVERDVLHGLGSADMKSGVAVILELARTVADPAVDVTYVFYACEEVDSRFNGVTHLFAEHADLVAGDAAVLAEPTSALVEAGCQGTMRVEAAFTGRRAHTARAWLGQNAVHCIAPLLSRLANYEPRRVVLDGCEFVEGLQAVRVEGGVANNVVPDRAVVVLNHRFAPDRSPEEATSHVRQVVGNVDELEVVEVQPGAPPALGHPLLSALVAATGVPPRAKLGWTDVARFAANGIPATNFGPGDPLLAHTAEERVTRAELDKAFSVLRALITGDLLSRGS